MTGESGVVISGPDPAHSAPHVMTIDAVTTDAARGDAVDERLALRELLVHAAAAIIVWRSVAVVVVWLLPVMNSFIETAT